MNTDIDRSKDLSHVNISKIEQYVADNQNATDTEAANNAVTEFLNNYMNWKDIVGYMVGGEDGIEDGEQLYGAALCIYSGNLSLSKYLSEDRVKLLHDELFEYEKKVRYKYEYKNVIYHNLVIYLHKLNLVSNEELKKYIKKEIFYSLAEANHASYQVECYAYRSVRSYLLESFKEEKVCMSSPTTFNDLFDCPILNLITLYGDDLSKLVRDSYTECLKITCFVNNTKLQSDKENNGELVKKHNNDTEEYLNKLMWAHYADNHKGVCIKYHFNNDITKFADNDKNQIAYFRDIEYISDMDAYRKNGAINLQDAFFVKDKVWEYENELRLLSYDLNGVGEYASIDAKNSIAAIYFGFKCPKDKQKEIIDILKGRKWVNEKSIWNESKHSFINIKEEHPIEFFQMEIDQTDFGKLKAVKIEDSEV